MSREKGIRQRTSTSEEKSRSHSPKRNSCKTEKRPVSAAVRDPYSRSYRVSTASVNSNKNVSNDVNIHAPLSSGGESEKRYLKTKEDLQKEANESFKEQCTFQPRLATESSTLNSAKYRPDLSSRIDQLHANHDKTMSSSKHIPHVTVSHILNAGIH